MSKLYIVPTPIGNLGDITMRALRILKEADLILAEDTRNSGKLLKHYEISNKLQAYHQHNEHKVVSSITDKIKGGLTVALITDAGTPAISDPGFLLVRECIREEIEVETLPGAAAFVLALVNSGLPSDRFHFEGFLPHKKGRQSKLEQLSAMENTMIFYESPYRLVKTLRQMIEYFGPGRQACVSRELTKLHEENARGTLLELAEYFEKKGVKGEIVLVVEGTSKK